eukprot:GHVR01119130.1.p1 GENE.GHVR01119130.1~~GHVR01119130.1.p1  ORF type:complete len:188 (+),score=34.97 GHVR01119130.1:85-564(+)
MNITKKDSSPIGTCMLSTQGTQHNNNPSTHQSIIGPISASFPCNTLELLECCVCCEAMIPPIFQCREGHMLCGDCKVKVKQCPVCRSETIDIRNRGMERLAESIDEIACKYSSYGCRTQVKYTCKKEHESKCSFRPFNCLHSCQGCTFEGTHLKEVQVS